MKLGSLFSGYGGLDVAVEAAFGAETLWHAEWEDAPSSVLERHWPGVPNLRDVSKVDWASVPHVDIIAGGFPCQDVSLAGRRAGMKEGTRSNLWGAFRTATEIIKLAIVVVENVRGLLSAKATSASDVESEDGSVGAAQRRNLRALGRVLGDLADLGFDAEWTVYRASDAGAPHRRERTFILAWHPERLALFEDAYGVRSVHADAREELLPVAGDGGSASASEGVSSEDPHRPAGGERREPAPGQAPGGRAWTDAGRRGGAFAPYSGGPALGELPGNASAEEAGTYAGDGPGDHRGERPSELWRSADYNWGPYTAAIRRWEQLVGESPAPKELNKNGNWRLSPKFTEWMMGLPSGWVTETPGINRTQAIKMAGNGVVPQQAYQALRLLIDRMD